MRRWTRWLLLIVLLAGVTVGPGVMLRRNPVVVLSQLRAGGFPTAPDSDRQSRLFSPPLQAPIVIVPPSTYYIFGGPNFSEGSGALPGGRLDWVRKGSGAQGTPARANGMIFVPFAATAGRFSPSKPATPGGIHVIDELSREILRTLSPPNPVSQVLYQSGILIAADGKDVYAFDGASDKLLWRTDTGGSIVSGLAGDNSTVYLGIDGTVDAAGSQSHELIAIKVRSGQVTWRSPLPQSPAATPAIDGKTIYCIAQSRHFGKDQALCAINVEDGKSKWKMKAFWPSSKDDIVGPEAVLHSLVAGNREAFVATTGKIFGTDDTGKVLWCYEVESARKQLDAPSGSWAQQQNAGEIGPLLLHEGFLFFATRRGARAIDASTGTEVWRYQSDSSNEGMPPGLRRYPPAIHGNVLVVPFADGVVDFVRLPVHLPASPQALAKPLSPWLVITILCAVVAIAGATVWLRWIKAYIALICLVLATLTLYAWASSVSTNYSIGQREFAGNGKFNSQATLGITSSPGGLTFGKTHHIWEKTLHFSVEGDPTSSLWWTRSSPTVLAKGVCVEEPPADLGLTHFAWTHRSRPSGTPLGNQSETSLTLPHWFVIALLAIAPFAWLTGLWRDRRRYPKGHCTQCGYDLRATTDRCPECGQSIAAKSN